MPGNRFLNVLQFNAQAFGLDYQLFEFVFKEFGLFRFRGRRAFGNNGRGSCADLQQARVNQAGDSFMGGIGLIFN
jgi:hypothetical protein